MSTNDGFTVPEFIELLMSSALGGLLTGGLVICVYVRYRKRKRLSRYDTEQKTHENQVIDIRPITRRQRVSIPIQDPPPEEIFSSMPTSSPVPSLRTLGDLSHDDRMDQSVQSASAPLPPSTLYTDPPTTSGRGPLQNYSYIIRSSRPSHSVRAASHGNSSCRMGIRDDRTGNLTTAESSLSRTTTNSSTLPSYDNLSSAPPRYPSTSSGSYSPLGADQSLNGYPPVPKLQPKDYGN